jgi:hypothetical protein
MDPALQAKYANDPLAQSILDDALTIQNRFIAEPIYARTGKGLLLPAIDEGPIQAKAATEAPTQRLSGEE